MIWIGLGIGFVMGGVGMFLWIEWANLFRTPGEAMLVKVLGDEQMNYFCEQAASGFEG